MIKHKINGWIKQFRNLRKYMKRGGVVYANVSFVKPKARFEGKKVLVTGGTSGIGLELVKEFLAEGAKVIATGRSQEKLSNLASQLNNPNLSVWLCDVSDAKSMKTKLGEIDDTIDVFVNNAGIQDFKPWNEVSEDVYDKVTGTNERGLFFACQAEGEYMITNDIKGKIINIVSVAGILSYFDPYSVSKWGAHGITKGLAQTLIPHGIIVNGVAPGNCLTNINNYFRHNNIKENAYEPDHKTERYVLVEEIAALVLFLASDSANSIVGQVIPIDGGWTLQ